MPDKPNILVVSPTFPYPLIAGGKIRIYNILKQLSKNFCITLLSLVESGEGSFQDKQSLSFLEHMVLVPIKQNKSAQIIRLICNLHRWFRGTPAEVLVKNSLNMRKEIDRLLKSTQFKAVQIEYAQGMQYLPANHLCNIPLILVAHDVSFVSQQRKAEVAKGFTKWFWQIEAKRMKFYEKKIWKTCTRIAVMSDVDRDNIIRLVPDANVDVVPNGVHIQYDLKKVESKTPTLVFTGWMRHLPNRDALLWFIKDIWPQIKKETPKICFKVIGKGVPSTIKTIAANDPGICLLGYVEHIDEIISTSWLSVVPIRIGSGSRLKILESMSLKTPVVSTTVGCEGLHVKEGIHIKIADKAETFSKAVLDLLNNEKRRQALSDNAFTLVKTHYAWDQIGLAAQHTIKQSMR